MSEVLKLLVDLAQLGSQLHIQVLEHHFASYDPATSKALREAYMSFHMNELESSDYRSAYHQFTDWLYGWNVNDHGDMTDPFAKRMPRDINMQLDRERLECDRILKTFETLCSLSRRKLKKLYADIEGEMPRVGQGLDTISSLKTDYTSSASYLQNQDKVWGGEAARQSTVVQTTSAMKSANENQIDLDSIEEDVPRMSTLMAPANNIKDEGPINDANHLQLPKDINERTPFPLDSPITSESNLAQLGSKVSGGSLHGSFSFLVPPKVEAIMRQDSSELRDDYIIGLQRDINHVFAEVDMCTEFTCNLAHELSMDFISNTLKTTWTLLNLEIPQEMSMSSLRDMKKLGESLKRLGELRRVNGQVPKLRSRKLHFKFTILNDALKIVDVNLFPNFLHAHVEGVKCANFSSFDSNLWLTGGISDIRSLNGHICLAQYVGHKSIITEVHFTKNDAQIVSCSYDRTVKIWNAQAATVDRTLVGHTDAVLSCHVSPDGRFVASGSMDNSIRFWDFSSGECITVIKKHTKWIKIVRFSHDGRYLATAGMDKKVYLWDVKILVNSRSPSHSRCIDSFGDYVLDMAMVKPSLLLTTSRDSMVRLFDYMTGHELHSISLAPSWACSVAFSESGEFFCTGSFDNNINLFETRAFTKIREIRAFNLGIMCVRFPHDLSYIVAGTTEGFLQQIML